jgi:ABC-2 type transport system permease protein
LKSYIQLVIANMKEMSRDVMQLFWFIMFPLIFVFIFGLVFSGSGSGDAKSSGNITFNVGLVKQEDTTASNVLIKAFKTINIFKINIGNKDDEIKLLNQGKRSIVVVLPKGLEDSLNKNNPIDVPVYYVTNSASLLYAVSETLHGVEMSVTGYKQIMVPKLEQADQPLSDDGKPAGNGQINRILPGILAMTLMQLGLFGSIRMLNLREGGTLKSLGSTPLPRSLLILSEVTVRIVIAVFQGFLIITIGHFVFGLTLSGNWAAIFGWILLGACTFVSFGYMLVSFVKTVDSGNGLIQVVQFILMFLSGIFIPVEFMPSFMQPIVRFIPLTYLADGLSSLMTGTASVYTITTDLLILLGVLVVSLALAMRFKWEA